MNLYAVIGNPVAHSRSPVIHALFAAQTGRTLVYERLLAPRDGFAAAVSRFRARGGMGANVTVPFKEEAFRLAHRCTERAMLAGAVNCLRFDDELVHGDNTDGSGLVCDLKDHLGLTLRGGRILLIGAGGAARGVIGPLREEQPSRLALVNRTSARARQLAGLFPGLEVLEFSALAAGGFDLVINATSASLAGEPLPLGGLFRTGMFAYDMMYARDATPFMVQARAGGAQAADGLGMLIEQAAESFFVWTGVRPETGPVREVLRRSL